MKILLRIVLGVITVAVLAVGAIFVVSELGGEVIVLRTTDPEGSIRETRIWIVEDQDGLWLRSGAPNTSWCLDLKRQPELEILRGGESYHYRAELIETPEARERVNALVARDYGFAETIIDRIHDRNAIVPILLHPHVAAAPGME